MDQIQEKNRNDFIDECTKKLVDNNIDVEFIDAEEIVVGDQSCAGAFNLTEKELKVAKRNKDWFPIFVHEYCHFLQYLEDPKKYGPCTEAQCFSAWMFHEIELPKFLSDKLAAVMREVEADCERRAFDILKSKDFGVDLARWAQRANANVYLYNFIAKYRLWPAGKRGLSQIPQLTKRLPTEISDDFSNISQWYHDFMIIYGLSPLQKIQVGLSNLLKAYYNVYICHNYETIN